MEGILVIFGIWLLYTVVAAIVQRVRRGGSAPATPTYRPPQKTTYRPYRSTGPPIIFRDSAATPSFGAKRRVLGGCD
jgi:hypothetical protein